MTLILIPAFIALVIKLNVLVHSTRNAPEARWISLILILAILNLSELMVYGGVSTDHALKVYFCSCVATMISSLLYVCDVRKIVLQKILVVLFSFIGVGLIFAILMSDYIVGEQAMTAGEAVAATKGSYFKIFLVFSLSSITATFGVLVYNYKTADSAKMGVAYAYTILGMVPMAVVASGVLLLQHAGIQANASMFMPLATTAFLLITAIGKKPESVRRDPRAIIEPIGQYANLKKKVDRVLVQYALGNMTYKNSMEVLRTELMMLALEENSGNISQTAKSVGVSRSTVYERSHLLKERYLK